MDFDYLKDNFFKEVVIFFLVNFILSLSAILIFIYWIAPKFIVQKKRLFLSSLLTLIVLGVTGSIDHFIDYILDGHSWRNFELSFQMFSYNLFRLSESTGLLLGILLTKKFYESQLTLIETERERRENELKLLRSQLNPHFLFNNLNNLNSLIDTDTELAKEYTNHLSQVYRYLIKTKDNDIIELQNEIHFAENYIFLVKTRFDKSYHFILKNELTTNTDDTFIPTGALQTLLENVIKHNKTTLKTTVHVVITITDESITVHNTKTQLHSETTSLGTGLENLQKRYKNLTDKTLIIDDDKDYFSITIPVIKLLKR